MVFRHLTKVTPTVELSRTNNLKSRIQVTLYKDIVSKDFRPLVDTCAKELQTNVDHFMKVEEIFPDRKGRMSVYISVEFEPI